MDAAVPYHHIILIFVALNWLANFCHASTSQHLVLVGGTIVQAGANKGVLPCQIIVTV